MKIALIGTGKTGGEIQKIVPKSEMIGPFNSKNSPFENHNINQMKVADAIIVFTPGEVMLKLIPILMDINKPVIIGSTGFVYPHDLNDKLIKLEQSWIHASNFSLGMNVVRNMIKTLNNWSKILNNPKFSIHEIHHTQKKDAPSGTALSWKSWLSSDKPCEITSERIGDVKGYHQLKIETANEIIKLDHEAKNRTIFAEGAIFAAQKLVELRASKKNVNYGLIKFEDFMDNYIFN